ncbi:MAG TPA: zf-TFIIB domain-containing protein [Acidimicrobiales bacterium]|nr:zf-TFIIB domain-containing protein [Acidimicrobiales bacterium]
MQCPVDGTTLLMSERQNVEIDYCPQCRGVWLDRGELDKLISRSESDDDGRDDRDDRRERSDWRDDDRRRDPGYAGTQYRPKKKKFLSEMFDFD